MDKKIKETLKRLEENQNIFWNISRNTGFFLNRFIKNRNIKKVLEIGTSNGYSGIWLAEALKETNGHLTTIESHTKRFNLAEENFKKTNLQDTITQIKGHAPEDIPKDINNIDLAFLDATKYEHESYLKKIEEKIKTSGFIIADNILSHEKELTPYIEKIKNKKNWNSYLLKIGSGILVSIKKPTICLPKSCQLLIR